MKKSYMYALIALTLVASATLLAACGGGGTQTAATSTRPAAAASSTRSAASPTAQKAASPTMGAMASPTVGAKISPTGTPAPFATPAASEADRAAAAAKAIFGGGVDDTCTPYPGTPPCIIFRGGTPQNGTAAFGVDAADGFMGFLGYTPEGEWKFWFGAQNTVYQLIDLPGDMLVCAGGAGLNVRASPTEDSEAVALLNDDTIITVDRFLLTEPGTTGMQPGFGWYHLTSPKEGWAFSKYLSAASLGDCRWHDAQVRN